MIPDNSSFPIPGGLDESLQILALLNSPGGVLKIDGLPVIGTGVKNYLDGVRSSTLHGGAFAADIDAFNKRLRRDYGTAVERLRVVKNTVAGEDIGRIFLETMQNSKISLKTKMVLGEIDKWARRDGTYGRLAVWLAHSTAPALFAGQPNTAILHPAPDATR